MLYDWQVSEPTLTQANAPGGGLYASYAWSPPCDLLRGRGTHYTYTGPYRLDTYAACFVADDLTDGPAANRLKSLPLCLVFPLLKCTTPALILTSASGYETATGSGGDVFAVSAYGELSLNLTARDDSDATTKLSATAWVITVVGATSNTASISVMDVTCENRTGFGCSAIAFSLAFAGQPADAGLNRSLCATVTNDQVRPESLFCHSALYSISVFAVITVQIVNLRTLIPYQFCRLNVLPLCVLLLRSASPCSYLHL